MISDHLETKTKKQVQRHALRFKEKLVKLKNPKHPDYHLLQFLTQSKDCEIKRWTDVEKLLFEILLKENGCDYDRIAKQMEGRNRG